MEFLAVDKPRGITSHDVVARLRRLTGLRQIGHAGTLDPLATGVLLLCLGEATRLSEYLMGRDKWYLARILLGCATETDDIDGKQVHLAAVQPSLDGLHTALAQQVGSSQQVPPRYTAIKTDGVAAHRRARTAKRWQLNRVRWWFMRLP